MNGLPLGVVDYAEYSDLSVDLEVGDFVVFYSDGVSDDMNKFLWSALGWDSKAEVKDILREYGKAFFGDEHGAAVAKGLMMLEENWVGPILENDGIERTLAHWQGIADKGGEALASNWRMQLHLFRREQIRGQGNESAWPGRARRCGRGYRRRP